MIVVVLVELAVAAVAGVAFVALYASRPAWRSTPAGRHMMAVSAAMAAEAGALLALGLGVPIPVWVLAALYAGLDAVVVHRLVLLWRARRAEARDHGLPDSRPDPRR